MLQDPSPVFSDVIIIVTGARDWSKPWRVHGILDSYMPRIVIEGNCPSGADLHARQWLFKRGLPTRSYTADWHSFGTGAGPIRNRRMLNDWYRNPNVILIGFPVPWGKGTQDCMSYGQSLGMKVENYGEL